MDQEYIRNSCISQNFTFQPREWPSIDSTSVTKPENSSAGTWLFTLYIPQSNAWHKAGNCRRSTAFMMPLPCDFPIPIARKVESIFPPIESGLKLWLALANRMKLKCCVLVLSIGPQVLLFPLLLFATILCFCHHHENTPRLVGKSEKTMANFIALVSPA